MLALVTMRPMKSRPEQDDPTDPVERLFRAEAPRLWRAVLVYVGGRRDIADDVVAETFARAIVYEGQIRRPIGWLYQVAFRLAAAEMRRPGSVDDMLESAVDPPHVLGADID